MLAHAGSAVLFGVIVMAVSAVLIRRSRALPVRVDTRAAVRTRSSTLLSARVGPVGGDLPEGGLPRKAWANTAPAMRPADGARKHAADVVEVIQGESAESPPGAVGAPGEPSASGTRLVLTPLSALVTGRLFGMTRVRASERTVCFSRAEGRDLFALLAVSRDGELQNVVIERLWPDEMEHGSRHLETGVRDINAGMRSATGLSADVRFVVKTGQRRHLASAYVDIDLWRFDEAYIVANTAAEHDARVQALRQMVALYEGPLLADRDDLWCLPLRQAAARHALNAAMRLAELEHKTDPDHALDLLTLAVDRIDPYSEVLWCQIMAIQGELNRLPAVRAAFQQFTERLKEIDTEPSRHAMQIYRRIVEG